MSGIYFSKLSPNVMLSVLFMVPLRKEGKKMQWYMVNGDG